MVKLLHFLLFCSLGISVFSEFSEDLASVYYKESELDQLEILELNEKSNYTRQYIKSNSLTHFLGFWSNVNLEAYERLLEEGYERPQIVQFLSSRRPAVCELRPPFCQPESKYRTATGICNSLENPHNGASFKEITRIIKASYDDRYNSPRDSVTQNLPNPRLVSLTIHKDLISPDQSITNMVPQFGQFIDHDLSLTSDDDLRCCSGEISPDCLPIEIYKNDSFYSVLKKPQTCMDFSRSTPYCFPTQSGVREQMNILTSHLDASNVYGSTDDLSLALRKLTEGRLRSYRNEHLLLPTVEEVSLEIGRDLSEDFMGKFVAGDIRVNEMPALTVMHTLFFREHNRIAFWVSAWNPSWNDEKIYQEARRILVAEWQNIVYTEWLPVVLGQETMDKYDLTIDGNYSTYDKNINPTIDNEFATAAFRFGHTLINGLVRLFRGMKEVGSYRVRDNFFIPDQVTNNNNEGIELILTGLQTQNAQTYDPFVTEDLTNFLFRKPEDDFGSDLIARNIQRGREHGIGTWVQYRKYCKLPVPKSFQDFENLKDVRPETLETLQTIYGSIEDVDLFTGGLIELPVEGGVSGSTFNCLKAVQFRKLKFGDRFFYTHENQTGSFSPEQLENIRSRTLGDIICENTRVKMTNANVFKIPSDENPVLRCDDEKRNILRFEIFYSIINS